MWLATFWDTNTGTFFPDQDWVNEPSEDGSTTSCWEDAVEREARICLTGLENMLAYYSAQLVREPQSSVPWGNAFHHNMAVMLEWCRRVVNGHMPHGALLVHTRLRLSGQMVVQADGHSIPG